MRLPQNNWAGFDLKKPGLAMADSLFYHCLPYIHQGEQSYPWSFCISDNEIASLRSQ